MPTKNKDSSTFSEQVKKIVANIPRGQVMTYKEVATQVGKPLAYRAVASIMRKNHSKTIPCHRVILSNGRPGGYNRGGEEVKLELLLAEGWNQHL